MNLHRRPALAAILTVTLALLSGCGDEEALRTKLAAANTAKATAEGEAIKLNSELSATKERLAEAKASLDLLKKENADLQSNSSKLSVQNGLLSEQLKASEKTIADDNKRIEALEESLAKLNAVERKGVITGTVTYFFNDNYGDKPDVGSEIKVWNASAFGPDELKLLLKYDSIRLTETLYSLETQNGHVDDRVLKELIAAGMNTNDDWARYSTHVDSILSKAKSTLELTADGNGAYHCKVPVGKYIVRIQSAHRKGEFETKEYMGKFSIKEADLGNDDEANVSAKFDQY